LQISSKIEGISPAGVENLIDNLTAINNDSVSPVLIVGAGPTGLSLAHELIRQGVAFRIVDMVAQRGTNEHRAAGIHARSLEVFHRYGAREPMEQRGVRATAFEIHSGRRRLIRFESGVADSQDSNALVLPQSQIEEILIERLHARNKAVERPVQLVGLEQKDGGVAVTLRHAEGRIEQFQAQFVVGCDGGRSTVRKLLGLDFQGKQFQPAIVVDARVTRSTAPAPGVVVTSLGPRSMVNIGEIQAGVTRIVAVLHQEDSRANGPEPSLPVVQSVLDEHPGLGVTVDQIIWSSTFQVTNRMVSSLHHGRVFLIGDAAHIHTPFGGQGMNTGVQDAANLGWKLGLVARGVADEALLGTINPERLPRIREVLWATERLQRIYMVRTAVMRAMRDAAVSVLGKLRPLMSFARRWNEQHTVSYAKSPAVSGDDRSSASGAGNYIANVGGLSTLSAGSTTLLDLLAADPRSHLLLFGPAAAARALAQFVEAEFAGIIKPWVVGSDAPADGHDLSDPKRALAQRWRRTEGMILIRPDGFIGYSSKVLDRNGLTRHLVEQLRVRPGSARLPHSGKPTTPALAQAT
jgi:2-polyprenyl-6-methoxyphenol hydroxylase-like FAD-dependent oxidoreductase